MTKAILVYGYVASCKWKKDNHSKFFETFGNDIDIFLAHDPDSESHKYIEDFKKLYSPVSVIDEPITEEDIYLPYVNKFLKTHRGPYYTKTANMTRHYINKKRVVKLLKDHMEKTGKTYEFICTTRLDLFFNPPIQWDTFENKNNTIYIPEGLNWGGLNDTMSIGDFNTIEKYASIYDNSIKLLENGCEPFPEILLNAHVKDIGLDIRRFEYNSNLRRPGSNNTNTLPLILNSGSFEQYITYYSKNHTCNISIDDYNDVVFRKIVPENKYFSWFGYNVGTGKWLLTFDVKSNIDINFPFIKTHNPDIFHSIKDIKANTLTSISLELDIEKDTYLIFIFDEIQKLLNISFYNISFTKKSFNTIHLVMYSNGEPFDTVKKLTLDSVHKYTSKNVIVHDYTLSKIKTCDWFNRIENLPVTDKPGRRDGYYCVYKAFCPWEVYSTMGENDILFYLDSSQYYKDGFTESIDKLCDIAFYNGFIAGSIGNNIKHGEFSLCQKINVWKKVYPECDVTILEKPHILASWFLLTKNDTNTQFMNEWVKWCMYTDDDFKEPLITEHLTGDQSIFNMLVYKYNLHVFYHKYRGHTINKDKNAVLKIINETRESYKLFTRIKSIYDIRNENGILIDTDSLESYEQYLAEKYINKDDTVLELGARYGSVSVKINKKLTCKTNQVVVEPDEAVWNSLERNKIANNCEFHIVKGFISKKKLNLENSGYCTTSVEDNNSKHTSYSLEEIGEKYNLKFNALVADCEGFLEIFLDENPSLYDNLRLIIFEADCPYKCNYDKIRQVLKEKGFQNLVNGFQNVWAK